MTWETNNGPWKSGYSGEANKHSNPKDSYEHERGRLQRAADEQKRYENAWKKQS